MTLAMDTTGLLARYLEGPTHAVALRAMAADPDWCASALVLINGFLGADYMPSMCGSHRLIAGT